MNFSDNVNIALVFGACLLFGVLGGIMANRIRWMPTITAFMILGFIAGPHGAGLISKELLKESMVFVDISLGLILYKLGNMLHPRAMLRSKRLMMVAVFEAVLTYVIVFAGSMFFDLGILASAAIAAISVSSSPAVLVHVSEEMLAKGPVSDRAKSLVAINNIVSFLLFTATLPFGLADGERSYAEVIALPLYRTAGAIVVGISVAWLMAFIARQLRAEERHYSFALVIGAVMLSLGVAKTLGFSMLFALLVLGVAVRSFETRTHSISKIHLGEGGDLFFIVLFVIAGAKLDPAHLWAMGFVPVLLAFLRAGAKTAGVFAAGSMNGVSLKQSSAISMMLVPMAGMAIGLVTTANNLAPHLGAQIMTAILAMVAIFETIGPFLVAYALRMTGEVGKMDESAGHNQDETQL